MEEKKLVVDIGGLSCKYGGLSDIYPQILRTDEDNLDPTKEEIGPIKHANNLKNIVENGVLDIPAVESFYQWLFKQLKRDPSTTSILQSEVFLNQKHHREKLTELMFESLNIGSFNLTSAPVLSFMTSGKSQGIIIESGHHITQVVPIYEHIRFYEASRTLNFGGENITNALKELLLKRGVSGALPFQQIKEKYSTIPLQGEGKDGTEINEQYELPDGTQLSMDQEHYQCTKSIFSQALLHESVYNTIMKTDIDLRKDFFGNVFLGGGNSKISGLAPRLQKELSILAPTTQIGVSLLGNSEYSAWKGGCVVASLSSFQNHFIAKADYDETGPSIVHRVCDY
jgi:actin